MKRLGHLARLRAGPQRAAQVGRQLARQFQRDSRKRLQGMLRRIRAAGEPAILSDYLVVPGLLSLVPEQEKRKENK